MCFQGGCEEQVPLSAPFKLFNRQTFTCVEAWVGASLCIIRKPNTTLDFIMGLALRALIVPTPTASQLLSSFRR
jgi:hypothetical protein